MYLPHLLMPHLPTIIRSEPLFPKDLYRSDIYLYNEPKNAFVADFIGDSNIVDGVMHRDFLVSFSGVDFPRVDRGFAREQSVQVVVRPEDIEVVSPVEGQLVGVVNDVIFKGVHFEMHVECEGREWLILIYVKVYSKKNLISDSDLIWRINYYFRIENIYARRSGKTDTRE